MPVIPDPRRIFICRTCNRETNDWPICSKRVDKDNVQIDPRTYSWKISLSMRCRDCGTIAFLLDTFIGHTTMGGGPDIKNTQYFPPLPFRIRPDWLAKLPENYLSILNEVYSALDNSLFRLDLQEQELLLTAQLLIILVTSMDSGKSRRTCWQVYN